MKSDKPSPQGLPEFFTDPNVRFPERPCLVPDIDIYQMPEGLGFQFRGGSSVFVVRGRGSEEAMTFLLPRLDGTLRLADILEESPANLSPSTILRSLRLLHVRGALTDGTTQERTNPEWLEASDAIDATMQRQLLFWGRKLGVTGYIANGGDAQRRIASAYVILVGTGVFGSVAYDLLCRSGCAKVGVVSWDDDGFLAKTVTSGPIPQPHPIHFSTTSISAVTSTLADLAKDADLVLVATRNAPSELIRSINRVCLDVECPYIRANDDGIDFELGPYVLPYRSACYTCMELRESSVRDYMLEEALYHRDLAAERPAGKRAPIGESVVTATLGASILVLEAVRILSGIAAPTLLNSVLSFSVLEGGFRSNRILRVPRCSDCSRSATRG